MRSLITVLFVFAFALPAAASEPAPAPLTVRGSDGRLVIVDGGAAVVPAGAAVARGIRVERPFLDAVLENGRVYVARGAAGVQVFDVSAPESPAAVAMLSTPAAAEGVEVLGQQLNVRLHSGAWLRFDLRDARHPEAIGLFSSLDSRAPIVARAPAEWPDPAAPDVQKAVRLRRTGNALLVTGAVLALAGTGLIVGGYGSFYYSGQSSSDPVTDREAAFRAGQERGAILIVSGIVASVLSPGFFISGGVLRGVASHMELSLAPAPIVAHGSVTGGSLGLSGRF